LHEYYFIFLFIYSSVLRKNKSYLEYLKLIILGVFVVSVVLSIGAVALVLKLSHRKGWYDQLGERKIHTGNVPRLGGIGFSIAFFIVMGGAGLVYGRSGVDVYRFIPCAVAMVFMLFSGAYDDFRPMAARYKFLLQIIAALCVIIPGFTFERLLYIGDGIFTDLGIFAIPVTFLWVVGLANAINLIDGVDGLAGGVSALIALFLGVIFFSFAGSSKSVLLCTCMLGVLIGFLVFNAPIPRAKIFMGDCGSQFLGFSLAILPLMKEADNPSSLPVLYAAALFAIPIFDTTAAVWRRLRDGKRIYDPDKSHLHHKLMNLGLNARGVVAVIITLQIIIGVLTYTAVHIEGPRSLLVLGAAYLIALIFFGVIHFMNRSVNRMKKKGSNTEKNYQTEKEYKDGVFFPPPPPT
jgi:UDP-GlcNAc:undecaprenyl-phosphate GlcNAc-1-phosphate transferase